MPHPFLTDEQINEWKEIQGNYTLTPNYFDLLRGLHRVTFWYYKPSQWKNYRFPQAFIDDFTRHFTFPPSQFVYLFLIAIFITLIRYVFERNLCRVSFQTENDNDCQIVLFIFFPSAICQLVRVDVVK